MKVTAGEVVFVIVMYSAFVFLLDAPGWAAVGFALTYHAVRFPD